ncbi:MAG: helix-turn-helix transcriptional regulator [Streptosporangiaceae bacterium]
MADPEHIEAAWQALGRQLAGHRQECGFTQKHFARLIYVSRSTVANVETGHQRVSREFWANCDKTLGTGEMFTAGSHQIQEAAHGGRQPDAGPARLLQGAGPPGAQLAADEESGREPIVVDLAAEALDLAAWVEQTNVGDLTIDALADATGRLARDYLRKPPLPVLHEAAAAYRRVSRLLRGGHQSLRQTRDLYVIAGQLLAFLSWISSDIGQPAAAEAHARTGWIMAEQADHDPLRAIVLIARGKNAYWEGRFQDAADLARRGFDCAPPTTARVLLASQLGDACQAAGDIAGALEAQEAARRARDEVTSAGEAGGIWACGRARQANYAMSVHLRAGDPAGALAEADIARQAYEGGEAWAYGTWAQIRIASGIAQLIAGRADGAASELTPILSIPPERRLTTLTTRLGEVEMRLRHPRYQGSTEVAELRQRITGYCAQAVNTRALPAGRS